MTNKHGLWATAYCIWAVSFFFLGLGWDDIKHGVVRWFTMVVCSIGMLK